MAGWGMGDEPRKAFAEPRRISMADVVMPTRSGNVIGKRCVGRPAGRQGILPRRPGLELPTGIDIAGSQ